MPEGLRVSAFLMSIFFVGVLVGFVSCLVWLIIRVWPSFKVYAAWKRRLEIAKRYKSGAMVSRAELVELLKDERVRRVILKEKEESRN